jgi:hypothetical protein
MGSSAVLRVAAVLGSVGALLLGGCRTQCLACGGEEAHPRPPALCADLSRGWCACVDSAHESRRGTPYVHAFHAEPAFLGRDLLVHVEREGDEYAVEAEVEWAFSRRLLLVAEVPYAWIDGGEAGVGDAGLGLRALGIETDRFLLSGQVSAEFPTAEGGLGSDETVVAPALLAWCDLGRWVTAQASASVSFGTRSGDAEVAWAAVLAKSFPCAPLLGCRGRPCRAETAPEHEHEPEHDAAGHEGHEHALEPHGGHHDHPSVLSLFAEGRGTYSVRGADEGAHTHEILLGVSAPLSDGVDLRAGWTLLWDGGGGEPVTGWVLGLVLHL